MKKFVFPVLISVFVIWSFYPSVYELKQRSKLQPIRYFELVHNFPTDYNFYLSRIRQGIEGRWTVNETYTSEPHQGSFLHILYLLMGQVGRWVRVPWERGGDVYHVARVVLGVALLALIAEFCKNSFGPWDKYYVLGIMEKKKKNTFTTKIHYTYPIILPFLAFMLSVTASTWPKLVFVEGVPRFGGYMAWWSVMDSLQRITFIPHLLAGQALILFLLMAIADDAVIQKTGNWIVLGLLMFLLGIIFPPGYIFVATALVVLSVIDWFFARGERVDRESRNLFLKRIGSRIIPVFIALPSLLYLLLMSTFYPWKRLSEFDILHPLPFTYTEYILAVGPILPIGLIGLFVAWKMKEKSMRAPISWVIAWIFLLIAFRFIPSQSPLRFSEMIPHVPLGILASYVCFFIYRTKKYPILTKKSAVILPIICIVLGIGTMYSSYLWQRDFSDYKMKATYPLVPTASYVMYPLKDFIQAMKVIQDTTSRDSVILSETTAGNYIPVYSGNRVYVGHDNTVAAEYKKMMVSLFFRGAMEPDQARQWAIDNRFALVFYGPQEKEAGGLQDLSRVYPFLKPVYSNFFVTLYQVDVTL